MSPPGRGPAIAFWLLLMGGLYWGFDTWVSQRQNPNSAAVLAAQSGGEVRLKQSAGGGYYAEGRINQRPVKFLVDTGADSVAVSTGFARAVGLKRGAAITVSTAGGTSVGYETRLEEVQLGTITLTDVRAIIVEGMDDKLVLLGMTFLRRVEFTQRDGELTLRHRAAARP
jgi:aspartyl protease family protein